MDSRCCRFLRIDYNSFAAQAKAGATDEALFQWACTHGRKPSEAAAEIWNAFMSKRGWRDESSGRLLQRIEESDIKDRTVSTFFDYQDADEGRPPRFPEDPPLPTGPIRGESQIPGHRSPWEKIEGIVHFGRMLDKIRLSNRGKLPSAWVDAKGSVPGFDGTCCRLLQIDYEALEEETLKGGADAEIRNGHSGTDIGLPRKRSRSGTPTLPSADAETNSLCGSISGLRKPACGSVLTMFDFIDLDEGRPVISVNFGN
jgi:Domain of unknown function (DUF5069)